MNKIKTYLTLTIEFKCNNNCQFCMLKKIKNKIKENSKEKIIQIIHRASEKYPNIIFSGAEVTLNKNLTQYAKYAKKIGFKNIRIQTNARKLKDIKYLNELIKSGINEYYITLLSEKKETHEKLTQKKNSFEETIKGINNLNQKKLKTIISIVVTKTNYKDLPKTVNFINNSMEHVKEIHFWNYLPMNKTDSENLIENYEKIIPFLKKAINNFDKNKKIELKYFPKCIFHESFEKYQDSTLADTLITKKYWQEFDKNNFFCKYNKTCTKKCDGFTKAYLNKYNYPKFLK